MSTLTLRELEVPLRALRLLSAEFAGLPAPNVAVSTIYPKMLELAFHDDLGAFEAWRAALRIEPHEVGYGEQGGGTTRVLEVETDYAGARLRLIGFGTVPARGSGGAP
ncbi:hypothetical protein ACQUSR_05775 [Streptomyces sp. P1-3]|uniref:hypothetical protein n=1 Tax=Streptomyces sp. P1-3 TaxID=3421658 RepID=UPI003D361D9E